jgi:hypothetical protein
MLWFKPSGASGKRTWCGRRVGRAGAQPHRVHGQWSGDMMMDWVPNMCGLPKRVRPLILSGASTQHSGGGSRRAGAGRGHQLMCGQGTRATHL